MKKFTADELQSMFIRIESGEISKEDAARYYKRSVGSINNYLIAKNAYEDGREVTAQNVSTKVFTSWAIKYGMKGEPNYKEDPHPERKHRKIIEQISVDSLCPLEMDEHPTEDIEQEPLDATRNAVTMCYLLTVCKSFHLEGDEVTVKMDFDQWLDICDHYKRSVE